MANKTEIAKILAICSVLPSQHRDLDMKLMVEVYYRILEDIDYEVLDKAALDHLSKSRFFPTPAELREAACAITSGKAQRLTPLESFQVVQRMVAKYGHRKRAQAYEEMDELTRIATDALGFFDFCMSNDDDLPSWRAQYIRCYEAACRRMDDAQLTLPIVTAETQKQLESRERVSAVFNQIAAGRSVAVRKA